ncbi:alkaline phosphatase [Sinomicrobium pectinilyticum]|uniref:Alkaline phosphatase n=1 Tax=Sinomicrobium pectinilyticum TaxID=1084421 RepID=A0A3N0EC31_SINP1|nr:choice-of-anchor I family protein [Sinomicrobium pectinilyticum]RNL85386.1 alkaline phosphatase [Sinomicrobium pectinilyticum]
MKLKNLSFFLLSAMFFMACSEDDDRGDNQEETPAEVNFQHLATINAGGTTEITAFDPVTKKIFTVNPDNDEVMVLDISDPSSPVKGASIQVGAVGTPNSVSVHGGRLAIAVEAPNKQDNGSVLVYNTDTQEQEDAFAVGALPDMVIFSPDGKYIVTADEGEPSADYLNDPKGTVSIIDAETGMVSTLDFDAFNSEEEALKSQGIRVFGPNATLSMDMEPEYVAISDDSQTAWVTLQENNAIARVNLGSKQIEALYPLGFKDYSVSGNEFDASDRDDVSELKNWPVYGVYHPDAVIYVNLDETGYLITANEGDARDYDAFSEEARVKNITLDATAFPDAETLQSDENLGRLKITTTLGDVDGDGDFDELYAYGARSFSVWSANGELIYDSGNEIASRTLELTPASFNADEGEADGRSDDKGAEPEAVEKLKIGDRTILFVGLERNSQVLVYDISNPVSPEFIQVLERSGDMAPEGVLAISAEDSPTEKDLLIVTNEDSGTISIYQN